jgi:hypothetical protein
MNAEINPIMKEIYVYSAKILILLGMIVFSLMLLILSIWPLIDAKTRLTEKNTIILLGLIQNPAALEKASIISEKKDRLDRAIVEMELAIGLLELHSASPAILKKYNDRLKHLYSKKEQPDPQTAIPVTPNKGSLSSTGKAVKPWRE